MLIVEDEILVAMHLEDLLVELGYQVVGPAIRFSEAMDFARREKIDFAVLDVNLAGTNSFPVAEVLRHRGIPFVFATGYGAQGISEQYGDQPVLQKPYEPQDLERALAAAGESQPLT